MSSKHKKTRHPPFVMLSKEMLDSAAWRATSHGARSLYVSLKRRYNHDFHNNGRIYVSQRQAVAETGSSFNQVVRWFRELQHYGFIEMKAQGSLGFDGRGKATKWRLTEVAYMRGTSSAGMEDLPTKDFLRWNGVRFSKHQTGGDHLKPKTESRYGKPERSATENRSGSATENRSTFGNNRYGKPEHTDGGSATENRSVTSLPLGRGGRVCFDTPSPTSTPLPLTRARRHPTRAKARPSTLKH